ncbi:MAG: exopolysaccharide Pel transporter PelG [Candidatus Riflebacteria bacterium]|nr:exopolysaccharide Pel transporter PelG [Candidatus Riflebacteria bacterium]
MAGIGFRLHKFLKEGTYVSTLKGLIFATSLVAGPWIVTMFAVSLMTVFTRLQGVEYDVFRTSIVYIYAISLVFTGLYQMPVTRYVADALYAKHLEKVVPGFIAMAIATVLVQGTAGFAFSLILPFSWVFRLTFQGGLVIVSLLWLSGIYLSCLRDYVAITIIFAGGAFVSVIASILGEKAWGLDGAMLGFFAGQGVILLGQVWRIFFEIGRPMAKPDFSILQSPAMFREHFWVGFLCNLGVWADKIIYWFSPVGQKVCPGLFACPLYDTPMFFAYVTIIPAIGMFFLNVETVFYDAYREFYSAIEGRHTFRSITRRQTDVKRTIRFSYQEMIRIQGTITLLIFVFAPEILSSFGYHNDLVGPLRWALWGGFFQVLFLFGSLSLLYFDFSREALYGSFVYCSVNIVISGLTAWGFLPAWHGVGYFVAALLAFLITMQSLRHKLSELTFLTFMGHPFPGEREAERPVLGSDGRLGEIIFRK